MLRDRYQPLNLFDLVPALGLATDPLLTQLDRLLDDDALFQAVKADLPVVSWWPNAEPGWAGITRWISGEARSAFGLPADGPIVLDGLVSLWQVAG